MNHINTLNPLQATEPQNIPLYPTDPEPTPPAAGKIKPTPSEKHAEKLERAARGLDATIVRLSIPAFAGCNLTRRRADFRAQKQAEHDHMKQVQAILQKMAEVARQNQLPSTLSKITRASQVKDLLRWSGYLNSTGYNIEYIYSIQTEKTLKSLGFSCLQDMIDACTWVATFDTPADPTIKRIQQIESNLIGTKIPGFFPTPRPLINEMLQYASIQSGHVVLEPSAGKGDILEAIQQAEPAAQLHAVEINSTLAELLTLKGFTVHQGDFLDLTGECFDRVVMNPPFEKGADIDHVQHAYSLLKAGGRLVSIMCEGPFFRSDRKSQQFRDWLQHVDATIHQNPENSFSGPEAFRATGTRTRMVVITKQAM
ncbi:methyltransferase [Deinococcus misasensis]|uniref:methyltransferase n=1 Tax=Deinococcus misasensis TaxID=392413 RepID=UPI00068CF326|nr:methyltransferase [Deinococcus misasensis]